MKPKFDAYDELLKLINFANRADEHLTNLLNNQKYLVDSINELAKASNAIQERIDFIEDLLEGEEKDETTRKTR